MSALRSEEILTDFVEFSCKDLAKDVLKQFQKLYSDSKKIRYIYQLNSKKFYNLFSDNRNEKNDEHALLMKTKGNELFQMKNYRKSIDFYNSGILSVSKNNGYKLNKNDQKFISNKIFGKWSIKN